MEHRLARKPKERAAWRQAPGQIAWQQKPATYFVCTQDLATPVEVQRRRVKPGVRLVEFDAKHHPFLSRPDAFAQRIAAEVDSAESTSS